MMNEARYVFPDVTLLVTHYNRSSSLIRLLNSFRSLGCKFGDIVVSDDGSKAEHLDVLRRCSEQYGFRLLTTPVNKGLGNNINKGQDAVHTPFTLYVQEDFVPMDIFPDKFSVALQMMRERPELDLARFYAYFKYPYLRPLRDGFSAMRFNWWLPGYLKFYMYSDHPHLRRDNFFGRFGRYTEGVKGDVTEYRMMMSFLQQKGKAIYFDDFQAMFDQRNSDEEPSTMKRNYWRESSNLLVTGLRHLYRHVRFNYDYLFGSFKNKE